MPVRPLRDDEKPRPPEPEPGPEPRREPGPALPRQAEPVKPGGMTEEAEDAVRDT